MQHATDIYYHDLAPVLLLLLLTVVQCCLQCTGASSDAYGILDNLVECPNHSLSCVGVGCCHAAGLGNTIYEMAATVQVPCCTLRPCNNTQTARSTISDLQCCVSALTGIGITPSAVRQCVSRPLAGCFGPTQLSKIIQQSATSLQPGPISAALFSGFSAAES